MDALSIGPAAPEMAGIQIEAAVETSAAYISRYLSRLPTLVKFKILQLVADERGSIGAAETVTSRALGATDLGLAPHTALSALKGTVTNSLDFGGG